MSRVAGILLISVILLSCWPQHAAAHAYLDETDPPLGAVLDESPSQFHFFFSQSIDPSFGYFRLTDEAGDVLQEFTPRFDNENEDVILDLANQLGDGIYRIAWEIMSSVDGHVTGGLVPFSIGVQDATAANLNLEGTAQSPSIFRVITRWLSYLSMLVLVGSILFTILLIDRRELDEPDVRKWKRLIWVALGLFFVAELFDLYMQSLSLNASLIDVATGTIWGEVRSLKLGFAVLIGLFMLRTENDQFKLLATGFAGLLMIAAHGSASHNYGMIGSAGYVGDVVHMLAAALWLGGLMQLALIWLPGFKTGSLEQQMKAHADVIRIFSSLALVSVLLLLSSGIYTALFHIQSWTALFGSLYGQALLMKILLLLPVIGMAIANRFRFVPQILASAKLDSEQLGGVADVPMRAISKLRRLVAIEASLLVIILFFAGVMTTTSPPHELGMHAVSAEPIVMSQHLDEVFVELVIMPLESGERVIDIRAENHDGTPFEDVLRIWLTLTYLNEDLGGIVIDPIADPTETPGQYRVSGPYLNLDGRWNVEVSIRVRGRAEDIKTSFEVDI